MHDWDITFEQAKQIQQELRDKVREAPLPGPVRLVAGADASFSKGSDDMFAAIVVLDAKTLEVVDVGRAECRALFPYVPGYLSFREAPALLQAWEELDVEPDLLVCDAQGRAHPRKFGLACHMGVLLDIPTIGSAKNLLCGEHRDPAPDKGSYRSIYDREGEVIGSVLRTRAEVNPVYVSVGHKITLPAARRQIMRFSPKYRIPEPIRHAHNEVNRMRRAALE
ncbi:endonuclease V [Persicimonas caeni]|uniref:Endonuclease V n=1 Tax=Persicimonas caeni TaxID=2292766 RepID=A0A4Y6Q0A2_PERCE|nr:deoxyribonuclease V [Persicimonas caeni]QDG53952.1 endonuclease V [Persicimonas caeni]QED35173.1 endonuclease V [Persicimonas caeni]